MFSGALYKLVGSIVTATSIGAFARLLLGILISRQIGSELFGAYTYLMIIISLPSAIYGSLPRVLRRFIPGSSESSAAMFLYSVFLWQFIILIVLASFSALTFLITPELLKRSVSLKVTEISLQPLLLLLLLTIPATTISATFSAYAAGIQRIGYSQWFQAIWGILRLLGVFIALLFIDQNSTALFAIGLVTLFTAIASASLWTIVFNRWVGSPLKFISNGRRLYHSNEGEEVNQLIRSYGFPSQAQSISGLILNKIPGLLLGSQGNFIEVAYLEIIRNFFSFANKAIPTLFETLLSRFVKSMQNNLQSFKQKFVHFSWGLNCVYLLMAGMLCLALPYWAALYTIEVTNEVRLVANLFAWNLVLSGLAHPANWSITVSKSTAGQFSNAIMRSIIFIIGLYLLMPVFGTIGIAAATAISTFATAIYLNLILKNDRLIPSQQTTLQFIIVLTLQTLFTLVSF